MATLVSAAMCWVAVVENDLVTPVGRGENASKTLRNDCVVRHLMKATPGRDLEIELGEGWRSDKLRVVAFLQDEESLEIYAAASQTLGS